MPTAEIEGSRFPVNSRWVAALLKSAFQRRPDIKQPAKPPFNVLTGRAHVIREREHRRVISKLKIKEHSLVYLFPRIYLAEFDWQFCSQFAENFFMLSINFL